MIRLSVSVLWTFICAGSAAHTGGEVAWEGWVRVMFLRLGDMGLWLLGYGIQVREIA